MALRHSRSGRSRSGGRRPIDKLSRGKRNRPAAAGAVAGRSLSSDNCQSVTPTGVSGDGSYSGFASPSGLASGAGAGAASPSGLASGAGAGAASPSGLASGAGAASAGAASAGAASAGAASAGAASAGAASAGGAVGAAAGGVEAEGAGASPPPQPTMPNIMPTTSRPPKNLRISTSP